MNAYQPSSVKPSELFFGVLMLIIIFMTSCNKVQASPKISMEATHTEKIHELSYDQPEWTNQQMFQFHQKGGAMYVPIWILFLLMLSYGALSGSVYLVQELKK